MLTPQEWKRVVKPVLPADEDWGFRGKLAYRRPPEWLAVGVLAEGSGWKRNQVYIWAFVMPLYVVTEHLVLSWSERVEPAATFGLDDADALRRVVTRAVESLPTQTEALQRLAASDSEASRGAALLLGSKAAVPDELSRTRDATVTALRLG